MNPEILSLQQALNYLYGNDSAFTRLAEDGIWGPKTSWAVSYFQSRAGLTPTGNYDAATNEKLNYFLTMQRVAADRNAKIQAGTFTQAKAGKVAQSVALPNVTIIGQFTRYLPWLLLAGAGYYIYSGRRA